MIDTTADTYRLRRCLLFPIAALDRKALEDYVGDCEPIGKRDEERVLLVTPKSRVQVERSSPLPERLIARHHALVHSPQVWVHPDYDGYQDAYEAAPGLRTAGDCYLDHVMNREMARVMQYDWLRLCPVADQVNTSGGNPVGGEVRLSTKKKPNRDGSPKYHRDTDPLEEEMQKRPRDRGFKRSHILYADPFDVTKMLNISPGTIPGGLEGVRKVQKWLFAPRD
jgi:hypothetical protein